MLQILYVSTASENLSDDDIQKILTESRHNNLRDGITGMLLWVDGVFIQILEGDTEPVRAVFGRIQSDNRHCNILVALEQSSESRLFAQWSMGFKRLEADMAADKKLFRISRAAIADRLTDEDGGLFLETVLAFSRDFIADIEQPLSTAQA